MSVENNKKLVRRFYELLQQQNYDAVAELCHQDFVFYPQIDTPLSGVKGFIEAEKKNFDASPDFKMPLKAIMAEGDEVAIYLEFEGTHTDDLFGVPATGKTIRMSLMMLLRIADGKIIEKRAHYDKYDILRQIGVNLTY
ncbi:ester cyclase [Domibacillus robiginosus]|uniref:ester cyclase n=1 Tax=Domibacillus robiginosus TaxID=1071054 RepID=UPI00067A781E|nr:ester cyclase [Domibacillus robiginosus]